MVSNNSKFLLLSFSLSFLLYLSFKPWDYTYFLQHLIMLILLLVFPLAITRYYIRNKMRAFWISAFSFLIGLFFLYRGFYFTDQFYLLDYIFLGDVQTVIESGNKTTYGIPLSLWWLESVLVYCALSIAGLVLAYFVERDNDFAEKV